MKKIKRVQKLLYEKEQMKPQNKSAILRKNKNGEL